MVDIHDFCRDELANGICPELLGDEEAVTDSNGSGHRHTRSDFIAVLDFITFGGGLFLIINILINSII